MFDPASLSRQERFTGCLLGGACGDALGSPFDYNSRYEITESCGPDGVHTFRRCRDGIGKISDCTQLTLLTASGLITSRSNLNLTEMQHVHLAYLAWLRVHGCHSELANTHADFHGDLVTAFLNENVQWPDSMTLHALHQATELGLGPDNDALTNGAAMRVAPIGLIYGHDPYAAFTVAQRSASLTHGNASAQIAAGAFAMMIGWAIQGYPLVKIIQQTLDFLRSVPGSDATSQAIIHSPWPTASRKPRPDWMGFGWTGEEALAIVIHSVTRTKTLREALIVAANHDGESSTTAAMTGNLAGALYGARDIPNRWVSNLAMRDKVTEIAVELASLEIKSDCQVMS